LLGIAAVAPALILLTTLLFPPALLDQGPGWGQLRRRLGATWTP
jgi:hypothetical protein